MAVKPIPDGYPSVIPYLSIENAAEAIEFYKRAFNATEILRMQAPDGTIGHAEIKIGDSPIMLSEPCDEAPIKSPKAIGESSFGIHLYVEDVDAIFSQALEAGAKQINPPKDQFYGDRNGTLEDPYGHIWFLSTHIEDVPPEEIDKRAQEMFAQEES